jgi:hypothetical protein
MLAKHAIVHEFFMGPAGLFLQISAQVSAYAVETQMMAEPTRSRHARMIVRFMISSLKMMVFIPFFISFLLAPKGDKALRRLEFTFLVPLITIYFDL